MAGVNEGALMCTTDFSRSSGELRSCRDNLVSVRRSTLSRITVISCARRPRFERHVHGKQTYLARLVFSSCVTTYRVVAKWLLFTTRIHNTGFVSPCESIGCAPPHPVRSGLVIGRRFKFEVCYPFCSTLRLP